MYYKEKKQIPSFKIVRGNITIVVNPELPEKRFVLSGKEEKICNSLSELLEHLDKSIRADIKKEIYRETKKAFYELEKDYPDASTGVIPFLEGKEYRTSLGESIYSFHMKPILEERVFDITKNDPLYRVRRDEALTRAWPTKLDVHIKTKTGEKHANWLLDPYQIIDIFMNNLQGGEYEVTFITPDNREERVSFNSQRKYNRIVIETEIGHLTQDYSAMQKNTLETFRETINLFVHPKEELPDYIGATFILNHWSNRIKELNEQDSKELDTLVNSLKLPVLEKWSIPWRHDEMLAAGVDLYYLEKPKDYCFADTDPYMKPYVVAFAKQIDITPDELIDQIQNGNFYMFS